MGLHVGVGTRDVHVLVGQAQLFRRDLAQHRQVALADLAFAGDDGGAAIFVDADDRRAAIPVAEAAPAVDVHAAAHAKTSVRLAARALFLPPDEFRRLVDALPEFAARDLVVVRRDITRVHHIHAQEVHDIDAEFFCGEIPCLLHRPVR